MGKRYRVTVQYTQTRDIGVWANDEEEAMDKAESIVEGWDNVDSAEAQDAEEDEDA